MKPKAFPHDKPPRPENHPCEEAARIPAQAVRAQLETILASSGFASSQRLSRFLRFVVEQVLTDESEKLKEYLLGVTVFDRDESYDPRTDPIVRVEASRLRGKLREYYDKGGQADPIIIELPKGSYIPRIRPRESAERADRSGAGMPWRWRGGLMILLVAVSVLAAAAAAAFYFRSQSLQRQLQHSRSPLPAPEYGLIWKPFLSPGVDNYVVFGSPLFLTAPRFNLFVRPYAINDPRDLDRSPAFRSLQDLLGPLGGPRYDYALMGDSIALQRVTAFLVKSGASVTALPAYQTTWDTIQNGNIIFLGAPRMNHLLQRFPRRQDFEWDAEQNIRNRNPQSGEEEVYRTRFHEGFTESAQDTWKDAQTYAVIATFPGLRPDREILMLSAHGGPGSREAVEYVIGPQTVKTMVSRLGLAESHERKYFQMLLRVYVDRGLAVRTEYVTHHVTSDHSQP